MKKIANCPICEKATNLDSSNAYRPFCSERCRLIDLGQWVNESYSISEASTSDNNFDIDTIQKH